MPGAQRRVRLCSRHTKEPSRHGATGGCCTFHPLLHAEGSQGWSGSRRRETLLRGELSTKGKLPAGCVALPGWEETPSKRRAPGSAQHHRPQPDARSIPHSTPPARWDLSSDRPLCAKSPRCSPRPARGPGGSGRRGPRVHRSTRKSERGQATAAGIVPGRGKKLTEELSCLTPRQSGARQPQCF